MFGMYGDVDLLEGGAPEGRFGDLESVGVLGIVPVRHFVSIFVSLTSTCPTAKSSHLT